jgi:serine phosphatase RsbU (regulator of sigma subunit)
MYIYLSFSGGLNMTIKKQVNQDSLSIIYDQDIMNDHFASLRYAEMIQKALLPNPEIFKGFLKDYFILLLPRDIVSGDFYYAYCSQQKICIAVGDCTGHGVPGALMSILGISFLNEILQSGIHQKANRILNLMREKVMKALNQKGDGVETKDSIDISLCILDLKKGEMQYAGANRPLIMIRDGDLTEIKADKMTIGVAPLKETSFINNYIDIRPGDSFYLFSDGYADQFGELTDKKFKYKHFKRMIHSNEGLPMAVQKAGLENAFKEWKGSTQQIDDVLVFGFQI